MSDSLALLKDLANRPAAVAWFAGLFHRVHVHLTDTDERFTVVHHRDHVDITPGFGDEKPNFVVPIEAQNLRNLAGFFDDDKVDAEEEFRIVKFMLQPCLRAGLDMPILKNKAFNAILKVEHHWQEALLDPSGNEDERLTIVFVNDQWLVIPGFHGKPNRRLVMTPAQVLDYQRRVFAANEQNSLPGWLDVARWYLGWRGSVTVPVE